MAVYQASVEIPRPQAEVFEYLRRPANLLKLIEIDPTRVKVNVPELAAPGSLMEFQIHVFGMKFDLVHEIVTVTEYDVIVERQKSGAFRSWVHEHRLTPSADGGTVLTNTIRFEPPGGMLGFMATEKRIMEQLEIWLPHGHQKIRSDLSRPSETA